MSKLKPSLVEEWAEIMNLKDVHNALNEIQGGIDNMIIQCEDKFYPKRPAEQRSTPNGKTVIEERQVEQRSTPNAKTVIEERQVEQRSTPNGKTVIEKRQVERRSTPNVKTVFEERQVERLSTTNAKTVFEERQVERLSTPNAKTVIEEHQVERRSTPNVKTVFEERQVEQRSTPNVKTVIEERQVERRSTPNVKTVIEERQVEQRSNPNVKTVIEERQIEQRLTPNVKTVIEELQVEQLSTPNVKTVIEECHSSQESMNFSLSASDTCESEDDEELLEAPGAYDEESEAIERISSAQATYSSVYSLDHLLANINPSVENNDKPDEQNDIDGEESCIIPSELMENMMMVNNAPALVPSKDNITVTFPGQEIFQLENFKCAFRYPDSLNLTSCGWKRTPNPFHSMVAALDDDELIEMICMGMFEQRCDCLFASASHLNSTVKFLFLLMSENCDFLTVNACYDSLKEITIHASKNNVENMFRLNSEIFLLILKNMGADLRRLLSFASDETSDMLRRIDSVLQGDTVRVIQKPSSEMDEGNITYIYNNFVVVLRSISLLQKSAFAIGDRKEIHRMMMILFQLSMDKTISKADNSFLVSVRECISAFLDSIPEDDFTIQIRFTAEALSNLNIGHHNSAHLMQVCPYTERGLSLRSSTSYLLLQKHMHVYPIYVPNVKPGVVLKLLQKHPLRAEQDYYMLHSIMLLIDAAVGNESNSKDRNDLQELAALVKGLLFWVKETIQCLDGTTLKDFIARLALKWTIQCQSMSYTQKTMFDYVQTTDSEISENQVSSTEVQEVLQ